MTITCTRGTAYEYHMDGIDLFSVSQIRTVAHNPYVGIPDAMLEAARLRGTLLHRRFWRVLAAQSNLVPMPAVIPGLEGYCQSMDEWVARNRVQPLTIEHTSVSRKFGYAGTPDALVWIGPKGVSAIVDLKTGAPTLTDAMQLVLYSKMEGYEAAGDLVDVYIRADGSRAKEARVTTGMKAVEWAWAMAALGVLQGRVNRGLQS